MKHEVIEKNIGLLAVLTAVAISVGGQVEIVPLMNDKAATQPAPTLAAAQGSKPLPATPGGRKAGQSPASTGRAC